MFRKILVPLDGSDCSEAGLAHAIELAKASGAALRLLHVIDVYPPGMAMGVEWGGAEAWQTMIDAARVQASAVLDRGVAAARAQGVAAESAVVEFPAGRVADTIVEEATGHGCDLIVMGSHGRRGFTRLMLGSDAERVLRTTSVPVLIVRGPEASAS
jgi:nucleotide-binding universal stress UspA family protein